MDKPSALASLSSKKNMSYRAAFCISRLLNVLLICTCCYANLRPDDWLSGIQSIEPCNGAFETSCGDFTGVRALPSLDEYEDEEENPGYRQLCECDDQCERYGDCCMDRGSNTRMDPKTWRCRVLPSGYGQYFYVYGRCSDSWTENETKRLCEDDIEEPEVEEKEITLIYHAPVYSNKTRTLYRNVFCAKCNLDSEELRALNLEIRSLDAGDMNPDDSVVDIKFYRGSWTVTTRQNRTCGLYIKEFAAGSEIIESNLNTRKCIRNINTCSGNVSDTDHLREMCERYTLYVAHQTGSGCQQMTVYKNFHCALCNGLEIDQINCSGDLDACDKPHGPAGRGNMWLGVIMDFNFAEGDYVMGSNKFCRPGQIHDVVMDRCYTMAKCGKLYKEVGDKCVPVLQNRSELNLNYTMDSDCFRVTLSKTEFAVLENKSVFVNQAERLFEVGKFEVHTVSEDGQWDNIQICREDYFFHTIDFTPPQYLLTEINLIVSIVCLMLHLLVYVLVPKLRNLPGKVLMCLAASLLAADLLFLVGGSFALPFTITCSVVGAFKHFSYLASFFWMNVMAYDISRTFSSSKPRSSDHATTFIRYSLYAWCAPAVVVFAAIITEVSADEDNLYRPRYGYGVCWLTHKRALLLFFGLPLAILLTVNIVFFSLTARSLSKTAKETKMVSKFSEKLRFFLYVKLASVLGLTWIFGFVAAFSRVDALWYPFIILIGLQGAFIFFSFTVKRKIFALLMQRLCPSKKNRRPKERRWFGVSKATSLSNLTTMQTTLSTPSPGVRLKMPSLQLKKT